MATFHSKTLLVAGTTIAVALLGILFPTYFLPLLPPLHPLTSQLLARLREVVAFLAFTTAIVIGILSSQRKDVHHANSNQLLEHHPLGSIFGEPGYDETDPPYAGNGKPSFSPMSKKNEPVAIDDGLSPLNMQFSGYNMEDLRMQRLRPSMDANGSIGEHDVQRKLHRKSSSLDDSVNYVPEGGAPNSSVAGRVSATNNEHGAFAKNKSTKRVSFSMASSPSSPKHVASDQNIRQSREDPFQKERDLSATSPGDLTGQADAFIARFKEQLRMQNTESIRKYSGRP